MEALKYLMVCAGMGSALAFAAPVPGETINIDLKQMCRVGYTDTVRPSTSYTNAIKRKLAAPGQNINDYELDHFIPLGLAGHPRSLNNLWLQPWPEARRKDVLEVSLRKHVCSGKRSLASAQSEIVNWK